MSVSKQYLYAWLIFSVPSGLTARQFKEIKDFKEFEEIKEAETSAQTGAGHSN
ncbi:MAG: hypothetical protein LBR26_15670 [Prevotella sp.]|jgi:hypothetical protein|nr:hypothetical protein [Prevotella sp.]